MDSLVVGKALLVINRKVLAARKNKIMRKQRKQ